MITEALNSGPFWADDWPSAPVSVYFDNDLDGFTHVTAALNGTPFGVLPVHTEPAEPYEFPWPVEPFPNPGRYELALSAVTMNLEDDSTPVVTARIRIGTWTVIVMENDGWHTLDSARNDWTEAPTKDAFLYDLLSVARTQCIAAAPALAPGAPVPDHYRLGQLMQAKALWQSALSDQDNSMNADGTYSVTLYPMDKTIKTVLRPRKGVPTILGVPRGNH